MPTRIQIRRDTSDRWEAANPVLGIGEPAVDLDTGDLRIGDGNTRYLDLPVYLQYDSNGNVPDVVLEALDSRFVTDEYLINRSYRKKIVHNLIYQHPDAAQAPANFGSGVSLYPQTFVIDTVANEILTISGPPQIVSVYDWTTGAYKGMIYSLGRTGVTESADIIYSGGRRYLYTVDTSGSAGTVVQFDITSPTKWQTLTPTATFTADVLNSAHFRNGHWVTASNTATSGSDSSFRSRARLSFYDANFNQTGLAQFPSGTGGGSKAYQAAGMPKMQGFDEGHGFFVFACGGGWLGVNAITPYNWGGVRLVTPSGAVIIDSLARLDQVLTILNANGCNGDIIENEGVQIVGDKIYTLYNINTGASAGSTSGGLVILEEFCPDSDALDFSSAAQSWTLPDTRVLQSGSHPLAADGKLHNLVTWDAFTSLTDICTYMQAIGQDRFSFFSSDASITDAAGTVIPAGYFVEIINRNYLTFLVRLYGGGAARSFLLSTTDVTGNTWTQTWGPEKTAFTPAAGLQAINANAFNRFWIDAGEVFFQFGVQNSTSGQSTLAAGNNVILAAGGLPSKYRPEFSTNALVAGHTSGPGMRFSADNTGLVQLVGVPASTHQYASGVVSWPVAPVL